MKPLMWAKVQLSDLPQWQKPSWKKHSIIGYMKIRVVSSVLKNENQTSYNDNVTNEQQTNAEQSRKYP